MPSLFGVWKLVEARAFDDAGKRCLRRSVRAPWGSLSLMLNE